MHRVQFAALGRPFERLQRLIERHFVGSSRFDRFRLPSELVCCCSLGSLSIRHKFPLRLELDTLWVKLDASGCWLIVTWIGDNLSLRWLAQIFSVCVCVLLLLLLPVVGKFLVCRCVCSEADNGTDKAARLPVSRTQVELCSHPAKAEMISDVTAHRMRAMSLILRAEHLLSLDRVTCFTRASRIDSTRLDKCNVQCSMLVLANCNTTLTKEHQRCAI